MYWKITNYDCIKSGDDQTGKNISSHGTMFLSSLVLSLVWVGSYQYKYNVTAFNTNGINIWAFCLWLLAGYLTLQIVLFAKSKIRISALHLPVAWALYFAGLLLFEYIGYYILNIRERSACSGNALVFGVVHGSYIMHVYYLVFPFLISGVYYIFSTISIPAMRHFDNIRNAIFQSRYKTM